MAVAIPNAEPVFGDQRQAIAAAFQCPVRETSRRAEIVAAVRECQEGPFHLWPEVGWVEILAGEQPVPHGIPGDLVCTGLLNADMPLMRSRAGDQVALSAVNVPCICGRTLPGLISVAGRVDDLLYTADGRRLGRLDPVFQAHVPVRGAQSIQETLERVRYVPAPDFPSEAARSIIERLHVRMGAVEVIVEQGDAVPRDANGKFRAMLCHLSAEERRAIDLTLQ